MSCPRCNKTLDAWTALRKGTRPERGDLSVCIKCATILVFDSTDPLVYHILTKEERAKIDTHTLDALEKAQLAIKEMSY